MTILQDWVELSTPAANGTARPPPGDYQDRAVDRHAPDPTLFPDDFYSRQEGGDRARRLPAGNSNRRAAGGPRAAAGPGQLLVKMRASATVAQQHAED